MFFQVVPPKMMVMETSQKIKMMKMKHHMNMNKFKKKIHQLKNKLQTIMLEKSFMKYNAKDHNKNWSVKTSCIFKNVGIMNSMNRMTLKEIIQKKSK